MSAEERKKSLAGVTLGTLGALLVFFEGPALFLSEMTGLSIHEVQGWIGFPFGILGYALLNPELLFGQRSKSGSEEPDSHLFEVPKVPKRPKTT